MNTSLAVVVASIALLFVVVIVSDLFFLDKEIKKNSTDRHIDDIDNTEKPVIRIYTPDSVDPAVPGSDFARQKIMSEHEMKFFQVLLENTPKDCRIFAQVALNQLVEVVDIANTKRKGKNISRIENKSVDFVVCDSQNNIVFAIELDDRSHDDPERQMHDSEKNFALKNAGIRLKRFRGIPDGEKIRFLFENLDEKGNEIRETPDVIRTQKKQYPYDRDDSFYDDYRWNNNFYRHHAEGVRKAAAGINYDHQGGLPVSFHN